MEHGEGIIDEPMFGRGQNHTDGADDRQPQPLGKAAAGHVVENQQIAVQPPRQGDDCRLARIELREQQLLDWIIHRRLRHPNETELFAPPVVDWSGLVQLGGDLGRNRQGAV
jgi:hypothetical protein